jgi:hypothetical protein
MPNMTAAEILDQLAPGASAALDIHSDAATLRRIVRNLAEYDAGTLTGPEAVGVFSVNVRELLDMIARLILGA